VRCLGRGLIGPRTCRHGAVSMLDGQRPYDSGMCRAMPTGTGAHEIGTSARTPVRLLSSETQLGFESWRQRVGVLARSSRKPNKADSAEWKCGTRRQSSYAAKRRKAPCSCQRARRVHRASSKRHSKRMDGRVKSGHNTPISTMTPLPLSGAATVFVLRWSTLDCDPLRPKYLVRIPPDLDSNHPP
jgi:hypothetical protein